MYLTEVPDLDYDHPDLLINPETIVPEIQELDELLRKIRSDPDFEPSLRKISESDSDVAVAEELASEVLEIEESLEAQVLVESQETKWFDFLHGIIMGAGYAVLSLMVLFLMIILAQKLRKFYFYLKFRFWLSDFEDFEQSDCLNKDCANFARNEGFLATPKSTLSRSRSLGTNYHLKSQSPTSFSLYDNLRQKSRYSMSALENEEKENATDFEVISISADDNSSISTENQNQNQKIINPIKGRFEKSTFLTKQELSKILENELTKNRLDIYNELEKKLAFYGQTSKLVIYQEVQRQVGYVEKALSEKMERNSFYDSMMESSS